METNHKVGLFSPPPRNSQATNTNIEEMDTKNTGLNWQQRSDFPYDSQPQRFNRSTCVIFCDHMIFFGLSPQDSPQLDGEVYSLNLESYVWKKVHIDEPYFHFARIFHTACVSDKNRIIIYGGKSIFECGEDLIVLFDQRDSDEGKKFPY